MPLSFLPPNFSVQLSFLRGVEGITNLNPRLHNKQEGGECLDSTPLTMHLPEEWKTTDETSVQSKDCAHA